ncbi:MAG TPA: SMC family ATPase [Gemmatimonadales bacterium]|jgi:exonuclease SbcC|nr:SMC family ATPase [Gemmatimonadales bacterium]
MELRRLRLVNFRQHADTELEFGSGITGIFGPNGSGKTTILEAIAWAIYGVQAARGDKDSIRRLGAKGGTSVGVELDFRLGAHEYRVTRGLSTATLRQDGQLVANSLKAVTEKLERALGMTHQEFFNTYFTGQKELAVMAALGKTERAAFLSRVLGYERLREAQERVREVRNTLAAEVRGLEAGLPDTAGLAAERRAAAERLAAAQGAAQAAERTRRTAEAARAREEPRWNEWMTRRERTLSLDGERRMAEQRVLTARQEFQRLDRELADALAAREHLKRLETDLAPVTRLKAERAELERLQREAAARRADQAQLDELARAAGTLERRLTELQDVAQTLARAEAEAQGVEQRLAAADQALEAARTAWVRDRQYAETKRTELLKLYEEVKEQRDQLARLGPEGTCPTCQRPLGAEYAAVLALLDRQLEVITGDGKYFRQRLEQLAQPPAQLREAEAAREGLVEEQRRANARAGELRAQAEERQRAAAQLAAARRRAADLESRLQARPAGYDMGRHDAVRAELAKLEPVALEAAALEERARRAEALVREAEQAERQLSVSERRVRELTDAVRAEGFSDAEYKQAKDRFDRTMGALREAELAVVEGRGALARAEEDLREVEQREAQRAEHERHVATLKARQRLHNELDRAFSDLRGELNARMRPEIAELASGFLADLTDGRYDELELTEDYTVTILEAGIPKPVISGGEEDVANLVLRLAISQMIAERAGQPLSLLVLDEIFGSLDDARRQHVVGLLRRLADRFPQVILITHIEQVREGLDRVIRVDFDPARGTSVVRDDTATLGAADAGVAA